jgi:hypothetical protein
VSCCQSRWIDAVGIAVASSRFIITGSFGLGGKVCSAARLCENYFVLDTFKLRSVHSATSSSTPFFCTFQHSHVNLGVFD